MGTQLDGRAALLPPHPARHRCSFVLSFKRYGYSSRTSGFGRRHMQRFDSHGGSERCRSQVNSCACLLSPSHRSYKPPSLVSVTIPSNLWMLRSTKLLVALSSLLQWEPLSSSFTHDLLSSFLSPALLSRLASSSAFSLTEHPSPLSESASVSQVLQLRHCIPW